MGLCLAGRNLSEGAPRRQDRAGGGHNRRCRQHRGSQGNHRLRHRPVGGVLDRVPALSTRPEPRLVISDAHTGLKAAIAHVSEATWQGCSDHWTRNALAHVSRDQHTIVAAAIRRGLRAARPRPCGSNVAQGRRTVAPAMAQAARSHGRQ